MPYRARSHVLQLSFRCLLPALLLAGVLAGCRAAPEPIPASPTAPATRAPTPSPEPTATALPTPVPTPTVTCTLDGMLQTLKGHVPYEEYALMFNRLQGTASLVIWFVDPDLNPQTPEEAIAQGIALAEEHAAALSYGLARVGPCLQRMADVINPIVVDPEYNGWYSGTLKLSDIPVGDGLSAASLEQMRAAFEIGYQRTAPPAGYPHGACGWPELREALWTHFSPQRQNVAFYFVADENGPIVWAQWDGPTDPLLMTASLGNILLEVNCFSSAADLIFLVVDEAGNGSLIGWLPDMDVNQATIRELP